jgi:hypothetical protein
MKLTGENRSSQRETCRSATLFTTNPTWTDPGSNPCLRGGRPAANRLSHCTADICHIWKKLWWFTTVWFWRPQLLVLNYLLITSFMQHSMCFWQSEFFHRISGYSSVLRVLRVDKHLPFRPLQIAQITSFLVLPSSTHLFTAGVEGFCDFIWVHSNTHHSR